MYLHVDLSIIVYHIGASGNITTYAKSKHARILGYIAISYTEYLYHHDNTYDYNTSLFFIG